MAKPSSWPPLWLRRLRGRARPRLTGVSTAAGCLQWEYLPSEREQIRALSDYLESRRALWVSFDVEDQGHVVTSILAVRDRLSRLQEALSADSRARNPVRLMRLNCERFLAVSSPGLPAYLFYSNLGELGRALGVFLEELANASSLTANKPLLWTFPSTPSSKLRAVNEPPRRYTGKSSWRVLTRERCSLVARPRSLCWRGAVG
jgi:hypothetical protein